MKLGWKKQEEQEEKKKRRKLMIEEVRIMEEKEEEVKDLIELRAIDEIVSRWFHKYLKMFEKKESERMLMRKT